MQYFDLLTDKFEKFKGAMKKEVLEEVLILNENLEYIKNKLVTYLKQVALTRKINYINSSLKEIIRERLNTKSLERHYRIADKTTEGQKIEEYLFLNFNYIQTFSYFYNMNFSEINFQTINIHGTVDEPKEVIFGFGDENTDEYREMENSEDVFLENIKSFKYLNSASCQQN